MFKTLVYVGLTPVLRVLTRPEVEGTGHIPPEGPVILASNHLSFCDSLVIPLVVSRRVTFLAKAEYFEGDGVSGTITRRFFDAMGHVPVPRGRGRAALAAIREAQEILAGGAALGIYPEGTRSRDGMLHRGQTGVARLAAMSGAPVVPVGLSGTQRVQPIGSRVLRPHRVRVRFGNPRCYPESAATSATALRTITDEIMAEIAELSGQPRADAPELTTSR